MSMMTSTDILWILSYIHVVWMPHYSHGKGGQLAEYCAWETFSATCGEEEVIVMTEASYGRMRLGRCIETDFGYVGCSRPVLGRADTLCSGRTTCSITVPNAQFDAIKPCLTDLTSYFEASYRCQPVIHASPALCQTANFVKVTSPASGWLASGVTLSAGCGGVSAPWIVEGVPGQRVNVTLWDFSVRSLAGPGGRRRPPPPPPPGSSGSSSVAGHGETACLRYATLVEEDPQRNKLVCGGSQRETFVYTSMGSRLEVRIHSNQFGVDNQPYFLLQYEIWGCPDPPVPALAWFRRDGDVATLGCPGGARWTLTCNATGAWTGDTHRTCHAQGAGDPLSSAAADYVRLGSVTVTYSTTVAVVIALGVAVGVLVLAAGLYCTRHRRRQRATRTRRARQKQVTSSSGCRMLSSAARGGIHHTGGDVYRELGAYDYGKATGLYPPGPPNTTTGPYGPGRHNVYASIRDWPLPPPPITASSYCQYPHAEQVDYTTGENIYQLPGGVGGGESEEEALSDLELSPPRYADSPGLGY